MFVPLTLSQSDTQFHVYILPNSTADLFASLFRLKSLGVSVSVWISDLEQEISSRLKEPLHAKTRSVPYRPLREGETSSAARPRPKEEAMRTADDPSAAKAWRSGRPSSSVEPGGSPQQRPKRGIIDHSSPRPDFTTGKNVAR